jgi:serine carboxypeptidase-like clade 4
MDFFGQYYDVRKECKGQLCYDFSNLERYLNNETVLEALGVGKRKFVSCSPLVFEAMLVDWMRNLEKGIPELLEDGIKLLVYAGEYDLICNWLGELSLWLWFVMVESSCWCLRIRPIYPATCCPRTFPC